jgi:hypothetical protein
MDRSKLGALTQLARRIPNPIRAHHGTAHKFDEFDISKIGTGEGNQVYGHGLYFAEKPEVALDYQRRLGGGPLQMNVKDRVNSFLGSRYSPATSPEILDTIADAFGDKERLASDLRRIGLTWKRSELPYQQRDADAVLAYSKNKDFIDAVGGRYGHMYDVNLHVPRESLLDWDAPLSAQPHVLDALKSKGALKPDGSLSFMYNEIPRRGGEMYERLTSPLANRLTGGKGASTASNWLRDIGVPGLKYLDRSSRGAGYGTRNFVMFDDAPIEIIERKARGGALNMMKETSNG